MDREGETRRLYDPVLARVGWRRGYRIEPGIAETRSTTRVVDALGEMATEAEERGLFTGNGHP